MKAIESGGASQVEATLAHLNAMSHFAHACVWICDTARILRGAVQRLGMSSEGDGGVYPLPVLRRGQAAKHPRQRLCHL